MRPYWEEEEDEEVDADECTCQCGHIFYVIEGEVAPRSCPMCGTEFDN